MDAGIRSRLTRGSIGGRHSPLEPHSLSELLSIDPNHLDHFDLARMNLLCAEGLPGAENLNTAGCLETLDRWTRNAKRFIKDCMPRFWRDPDRYHGHEGVFRFMSLATFLKHPNGLKIGYQPSAIGNYDFSDSRDDLLHGLLTRRLGTCASLPVLFAAMGRRLGWPMHLAIAKRHVLCQWVNSDGSHRNLEGSGPGGGDSFPDEHFHHNPRPLTHDELASGRYLRPVTNAESLALFLETRGHCLTDNKRFAEAEQAYHHANRFAPRWSQLQDHLYSLMLHERRAAGVCSVARGSRQAGFPTMNSPIASRALFPTISALSVQANIL